MAESNMEQRSSPFHREEDIRTCNGVKPSLYTAVLC